MQNYKNQYKKYKRMHRVQKEMREHYESLFKTGVGELRFELLQVDALKNALQEIIAMTNDPLAKKVAEMAIERHNVDKLIHARKLFW